MGAYKNRKIAKGNLKKILEDPSKVLFIHYSYSKTYEDDAYGVLSPIITSIVIKSLDNQIDTQLAIHFEADKGDLPIEQIQDSYRELELRILRSFNEFVKRHQGYVWIHWDMKNIHFGFDAIKHRYEKIFESLSDFCEIPNSHKQNLRVIIEGIYGEGFVNGPDSLRSLKLCNNKNVLDPCYLSMEEESLEFERKNFDIVIKSVDCKVDFIRKSTIKLVNNNLIICNKNNFSIFVDIVNHPIFTFIGWLSTLIGLVIAIIAIV